MESLCSRALHAFILVLQVGDRIWIEDWQFKREDIDHFSRVILTHKDSEKCELLLKSQDLRIFHPGTHPYNFNTLM